MHGFSCASNVSVRNSHEWNENDNEMTLECIPVQDKGFFNLKKKSKSKLEVLLKS